MRFQLVRYFTLASLAMFALVAAALTYFEHQQSRFFNGVQAEQAEFFKQVQENFAKQQADNARRDLMTIHENGNVNLTRLFSNALWEKDFAPFVAKAQAISAEACRAIADEAGADGKPVAPPQKSACFADLGKRIMALPEFPALNAKVFDAMKKSTVFKIKVYDLRGITVYSSEHKQIGQDKRDNPGFRSAMAGTPANELTHRDKFNAWEGVVDDRDLIGSYLPVLAPASDQIVGVLEVYSDVTRFTQQMKATAEQIRKFADLNQERVESIAAENQVKVDEASSQGLAIVLGLLALLFAALFLIVRRAQTILTAQEKDREHAQQQLAQSEKLASLGQMVAGVAHQLNTPLAFTHSNVSMVMESLKNFETPLKVANKFAEMVKRAEGDRVVVDISRARPTVERIDEYDTDVGMLSQMLCDTLEGIDQMRELVENLRDFTRLDRSKVTTLDLNRSLRTVAYIARSAMPAQVRLVEEFGELPQLECNPSQLNQVFLNLINNAAQAIEGDGTVTVRSAAEGGRIRIDVIDTGSGIPAQVLPHVFENYYTTKPKGVGTGLGLPIAKSIVEEHGGEISVSTQVGKGTTFTVFLPTVLAAELKQAA